MTDDVNVVQRGILAITIDFQGLLKARQVAVLLDAKLAPKAIQEADAMAEQLFGQRLTGAEARIMWSGGAIDSMIAAARNLPVTPELQHWLKNLTLVQSRGRSRILKDWEYRGTDLGQPYLKRFMGLDQDKQELQTLTDGLSNYYRRSPGLAAVSGHEFWTLQNRLLATVGPEGSLRQFLERPDLWGKAAEAQQRINFAWTSQLDPSQQFRRWFLTEGAKVGPNPFVRELVADPEKMGTHLRGLAKADSDNKARIFDSYIDRTIDLAKTADDVLDLPAEKKALIEAMAGAAKRIKSTLASRHDELVAYTQLKELVEAQRRAAEGSVIGAILGSRGIGGAVIGGVAGGATTGDWTGGLIGAGIGTALTHPAAVVRQMAAYEALKGRIRSAATKAATATRDGTATLRRAVRTSIAKGVAAHEVAEQQKGDTDEAVANRARLMAAMSGADAATAPAAAAAVVRARQEWRRTLPPEGTTSTVAYLAAQDRLHALTDIMGKKASLVARAHAMRAYPRMRSAYLGAAFKAAQGKRPSAAASRELALLTDWSPDPLYEPDSLLMLQASAAQSWARLQAPKPRPPSGGRSRASRRLMGPSERLGGDRP